LYACVLSFQV